MFDYSTKYLGLNLSNPLIISACTKTRDLEMCKKFEELGASAIVLPSLFEEEIMYSQHELDSYLTYSSSLSAESFDFIPSHQDFGNLNGESYLEMIHKHKKNLKIPLIASLNGHSFGGWSSYAKKIQEAGADALELNIYFVPTNINKTADEVEREYLKIIESVKKNVTIPVSVKLGPYFSSFANMAKKIESTGVEGLVLFNRFIEPDFDLSTLDLNPTLEFSNAQEMKLTLHWTAILHKQVNLSLCSGRGVKDKSGFIKLLMAGADTVGIASVLFQEGPHAISKILSEAKDWFEENEYSSVSQLKGSMSYKNISDPSQFERANYMKILKRNYE